MAKPVRKKAAVKKPAPGRAAKTAAPARANGRGAGLLQREVEQFLYRQAEALDEKRWADFIGMFTDDGMYWMPPAPHYTTWEGMPSIFIEDRDLMTVRMKRVQHPHAWSQHPDWGTNHVVSNVIVERVEPKTGEVHVRSRFHMMELRRDELRHFAGTYRHRLKLTKDGFRIKFQRVDMVNSQAPYEYVLQVWV
ncbi:MAG TPA: aromatic-ring-hydroxylating dioxygenase subunit beta [Burkholderiales bacterium]|nr:aromatic-ring-hydroxylating dioxygenase subunit beta [Burkholderiales bacterium]